jgi:hypothetical protein
VAKPDEILDRTIEGGMYLLAWGGAIVLAVIVFAFVAGVVAILSGSLFWGIAVGLSVTFGAGYLLYQIGKHIF